MIVEKTATESSLYMKKMKPCSNLSVKSSMRAFAQYVLGDKDYKTRRKYETKIL